MKLYILNELIEPDGVLPEVVNYVYKSKEEVTKQIRRRVEFWEEEYLDGDPMPQGDEVEFTTHSDGTGLVRFFGSYVTFTTHEFDTDDL